MIENQESIQIVLIRLAKTTTSEASLQLQAFHHPKTVATKILLRPFHPRRFSNIISPYSHPRLSSNDQNQVLRLPNIITIYPKQPDSQVPIPEESSKIIRNPSPPNAAGPATPKKLIHSRPNPEAIGCRIPGQIGRRESRQK